MTFTFSHKQQHGADVHAFLTTRRSRDLVIVVFTFIPWHQFFSVYLTQLHQCMNSTWPYVSYRFGQSVVFRLRLQPTEFPCVLANRDTFYTNFNDCVEVLRPAEGPSAGDICICFSCASWHPWIMKVSAMHKERHNLDSQTSLKKNR